MVWCANADPQARGLKRCGEIHFLPLRHGVWVSCRNGA
uniref:Uncharacterized protein n=1 Tax=Anguilla anguilla TaxID=7936 RepID=A0A0E9TBP9_ANGAN